MIFSYTLIDTFHNVCPRQAHERFWLKIPVPRTPEMDAGTSVHVMIDQFIKDGRALPDKLQHIVPVINSLLARGGEAAAEQKMAVDRQLQATEFWADDAYIRGSLDFLLVTEPNALVVDWKTGKKRDKELQLMLYALFVFAKHPSVERVTCLNFFIADASPMGQPRTWARSELPEMWRHVLPLVHEIEQAEFDGKWPERASGLCGWCPVKQCRHWRER